MESPGVNGPRLISLNGTLKDAKGRPLSGVVGLRFAIYKDQEGGAPLWVEVQNAQFDEQGRYTVLLGSYTGTGLPLELFTSSEARWLGVQPLLSGEEEQPRTLLVSVPYALKAADADTLGGKPVSAFVLSGSESLKSGISSGGNGPTISAISGSGTTGKITKWIDGPGGVAGDSIIAETAGTIYVNGAVVVGNDRVFGFESTTPGTNAGRFYANTGNNMVFETNSGANSMLFQLTGGKVGIGTATPGSKLEISSQSATAYSATLSGGPVFAPQTYDGLTLRNDDAGANFNSIFFTNRSSGVGSGRFGLIQDGAFGGAFSFMTRSTVDTNMYERVRITNLGRMGIGTTSPTEVLDVVGNIKASGSLAGASVASTGPITGTQVTSSGTVTGTQLISTIATGTAPLTVASTTVVPNLNASMVGGFAGSALINAVTAGNGISVSTTTGNATISASAAERTRAITYLGGCDTCSALTTADDQKTIYYNAIGTMTVAEVRCFTDAGVVTIDLKRDNGATATILTGPLTCNGSTPGSFAIPSLVLADKLDFDLLTTDGTAKRVTVSIKTTVN